MHQGKINYLTDLLMKALKGKLRHLPRNQKNKEESPNYDNFIICIYLFKEPQVII
jgi:hypothetical protein